MFAFQQTHVLLIIGTKGVYPIRWSFGDRWLNWCAPGVRRRNGRRSRSFRRGRSVRGFGRPAGRQVVTAEGIEVLALLTRDIIFDGLGLDATVSAIDCAGALAVLPWGAGKWLGARGLIMEDFLREGMRHKAFAGDNGGRPGFWPVPEIFGATRRAGRPVISGSGPLPLPGEECRAGSFEFWIEGRLPAVQPAGALRDLLKHAGADTVHPFGESQRAWRFVRDQLALRIGRRLRAE